MNEIKLTDDVVIRENLRKQQKILEQRYNKWNQGHWKKKRNCEKTIYSVRNSIQRNY